MHEARLLFARRPDRECVAEHLSLFRLRGARGSLEEIVLAQDIVYVGGGSRAAVFEFSFANAASACLFTTIFEAARSCFSHSLRLPVFFSSRSFLWMSSRAAASSI